MQSTQSARSVAPDIAAVWPGRASCVVGVFDRFKSLEGVLHSSRTISHLLY